jgi:branched-chain amino acid transport system ATP-binding protein
MGLAPLVVRRLLEAVREAADERGTAVLLVEQHVRKALLYADRVYVMRRGRIELSGTATEIRRRLTEVEEHYLSTSVASDDVAPSN